MLTGHTSVVWSAAFSADGNRIVTASDDSTARLWDAATGEAVAVFQPAGYQNDALSRLEWRPVKSVAFSPDGGQIITALWDKTARIWDVRADIKDAITLRYVAPKHLENIWHRRRYLPWFCNQTACVNLRSIGHPTEVKVNAGP